jgi:DNA-directed RNA polymerase II subunit RPB3
LIAGTQLDYSIKMSSNSVFENIQEVDSNTISFTLTPTRVSYANTLRRAIQTEVPSLGFCADMKEDGSTSDVKVFKNTTPMSNEMLADRIGLLPIANPNNTDDWEKESVIFKLHIKNETSELRYVTASDFECYEIKEDENVRIENTRFFHPNKITGETCLIAVLKPFTEGQPSEEIHLEAYASVGKGREHARFNPTCQASYGYTLDSDPERIQALLIHWLQEQKKVDIKELEKDEERKKRLVNEFNSLEINRCYKIDADGEPDSFDFQVESVGTINVYKIISRALQELVVLFEKYSAFDRGDLPENVEIRPTDKRMKGFDFYFTGEDHTLGVALQTWLDDNKVGRGESEGGCIFAGYCVPHPLRDQMKFTIGIMDGKESTARILMAEAAKGVSEIFSSWFVEFSSNLAGSNVNTDKEVRSAWEAHKDLKEKENAKKKTKETNK